MNLNENNDQNNSINSDGERNNSQIVKNLSLSSFEENVNEIGIDGIKHSSHQDSAMCNDFMANTKDESKMVMETQTTKIESSHKFEVKKQENDKNGNEAQKISELSDQELNKCDQIHNSIDDNLNNSKRINDIDNKINDSNKNINASRDGKVIGKSNSNDVDTKNIGNNSIDNKNHSTSDGSSNVDNNFPNTTSSLSNDSNNVFMNDGKQNVGVEYMQQQSQIFVFSTSLANEGADAVLNGQFPSIIAYHFAQETTKNFLDSHPQKIQQQINGQNPTNWVDNMTIGHKSTSVGYDIRSNDINFSTESSHSTFGDGTQTINKHTMQDPLNNSTHFNMLNENNDHAIKTDQNLNDDMSLHQLGQISKESLNDSSPISILKSEDPQTKEMEDN